MRPMGFVIHDIYQINCHTERKKMVSSFQDKPAQHLHIAGKESCPTLFEVKDKTPCSLTSQTSELYFFGLL